MTALSTLTTLARLLGIRPDQTEDALRSERAARATLNRRGLLLGGAAAAAHLATGAAWSFGSPQVFGTHPGIVHAVWVFEDVEARFAGEVIRGFTTGFFISREGAAARGDQPDFYTWRSA